MAKQRRGIYKRTTKTMKVETRDDLEAIAAKVAALFDPYPMLAEVERICSAVVDEAVERNRNAIEADLKRQRDLIESIGTLMIRRAKELNVETLRRDPDERARQVEALAFDHWRANTLRGLNESALRPFVADATEQERDAHAALWLLGQLRGAMTAGRVEAVATLALRLGRTMERFNVRPFEPYVGAARAIEDRKNEDDAHRKERDDGIRAVSAEHPKWSAGQVGKHPPLLHHFPEVGKLSARQLRRILAS